MLSSPHVTLAESFAISQHLAIGARKVCVSHQPVDALLTVSHCEPFWIRGYLTDLGPYMQDQPDRGIASSC